MATDPYPAIRKQVEALIRATERVSEHRAVSKADLDAYDAARAALNSRVEALLRDAVLNRRRPAGFGVDDYCRALLDEEPDATLDVPRRSGPLGGSHTHAGGDE